jgi:hypothetical protein
VVAITGVHALLYSSESDALREILRDVFGWRYVEERPGWLIFALPPAELAVHPVESGQPAQHELSFMCDDLAATIEELRARGVEFRGEPTDQRWGITTTMVLPGDVEVLLYEPRHTTAI